MKRMVLLPALLLLAGFAFTQEALPQTQQAGLYTQRVLAQIGLDGDEIEQVLEIQQESQGEIRRHNADLQVRKAELARLLMEESPNMRQVERNLRATAEIEVDIRMVEIRREIEIRGIVGTDRWARIVQVTRARIEAAGRAVADEAATQFQRLQQAITEKQQELSQLIQNSRTTLDDEEIQAQLRELQAQFQELQNTIRERM